MFLCSREVLWGRTAVPQLRLTVPAPTLVSAIALTVGSLALLWYEQSLTPESLRGIVDAAHCCFAGELFWKSASGLADGLATGLLLALLWCRGLVRADRVQVAVLTFLLSGLLVNLVKVIVQRGRPFDADSYAWPSGHSASAASLALVFGGVSRSRTILAIALAIVLGASRVALGRHWPADVLAGFACAMFTAAAVERLPTKLPAMPPRRILAAVVGLVAAGLLVRAGTKDLNWHMREAWRAVCILGIALTLTASSNGDRSGTASREATA